MNFVDVQPQSFLDYAWTSPSPSSNVAKSSKTSRKQNRCCDQCRKGKRACDAAILEDSLLDVNNSSGENPTVFHYSDVFGPLAPCGNCEKTKKDCTFEWLRSQRISQATPQISSAPPTKKRRTQSSSSQNQREAARQLRESKPHHTTELSDTPANDDIVPQSQPIDFGLTFADFPGNIPACNMMFTPSFDLDNHTVIYDANGVGIEDGTGILSSVIEDEETLLDRDSGQGSSLHLSPEEIDESGGDQSRSCTPNEGSQAKGTGLIVRKSRKRRRRCSSSTLSLGRQSCPTPSSTADLPLSTNNTLLTEGLLKIYQDSFEHHLSCWLTERTCPYGKDSEVSLPNDDGPDWNRIYHRVFKLDRSSSVRGRSLSSTEDKAASKALNLAIFSFATQWARPNQSTTKYPFHSGEEEYSKRLLTSDERTSAMSQPENFDGVLQMSAWHQARMALQDAEGIESFRVVLAQIVFSLTQKPCDKRNDSLQVPEPNIRDNIDSTPFAQENAGRLMKQQPAQPEDKDVEECEDLLSRLNIAIDSDGPPVHLEQGLRLIHSLRSRLMMAGTMKSRPKKIPARWKHSRLPQSRLEAGDRATIDLLFWLGIMFDTLSSAMHKRPLVVSLEDSDLPTARNSSDDAPSQCAPSALPSSPEDLWDEYLFSRQRKRLRRRIVRWPCSYEVASSLLCDAAPLKVLLFRKVTRIQAMLSRGVHGEVVEKAVQGALDVYDHWQKAYDPFIRDCIENHDNLHWRVQSWYICLSGHWHLATLLLADLIEIADESEQSDETQRRERASTNFVATFRQKNCYALSDIARRAVEEVPITCKRRFNSSTSQGALLTEPWTVVLIRAFATAGAILLESSAAPEQSHANQEDAFRRADDCVRALWYLGRKSAMALSAAKILGDVLKRRQRGADDVCSFLENDLWDGMDHLGDSFGAECI